MLRRLLILSALGSSLLLAGCGHHKVTNPIANIDSKQPDKVLFDRAVDAINHGKYDVGRMTMQTLINTYPDSEYVARAKLAVGDSWYAEGTTPALQQAEIEYKDFITFFPNMPEAAEAQMKVGDIHFKQLNKPDRDFTHAIRAEQEYQQMILQFPDSKLVPEAKQKLREVQELLAEREFRIGRFYYLKESYPAAIARLQTLVDTYPLYSGADEALYMLGSAWEKEGELIRERVRVCTSTVTMNCVNERDKEAKIREYEEYASKAYARIVSRYPVAERVGDAKARLQALHQPVPTPTPDAIAQNQAEQKSRRELSVFAKVMSNLHSAPDLSTAAKVGEPTLAVPQETSATDVVQTIMRQATVPATPGDTGKVSVETVGSGAPAPNQPAPRSDQTAPAGAQTTAPQQVPPPSAGQGGQDVVTPSQTGPMGASAAPADNGIGELTPNSAPATTAVPADKSQESSSKKK